MLSAATFCSTAAVAEQPDVVLITIDTLRSDALGWVAGKNATPTLDRLAGSGASFPGAVAPAPVTLPSHASILTGLVPPRHGATDNGIPLGSGPASLAERLGAAGWSTGAFISGLPLAKHFGLDRGFDRYDDQLPVRGRERRAPETVRAALSWLEGVEQPAFLWLHLYDPHDPYEAPGTPPGASTREAYLAEVRAVDAALEPLLKAAQSRGALIVATADHGEGLGEHGEATHGLFVFESTIAVPLMVSWPGKVTAGRHDDPVRLVDITPTILDLLGLPALAEVDGISLRPWLEGRGGEPPGALSVSDRGWASYGWAPLAAVRKGAWKLIRGSRTTLHDLGKGGEGIDRLRDNPKVARALAEELRRLRERAPVGTGAPSPIEKESLATLEALGYVGSGGTAGRAPVDGAGLADPRDRLEVWNELSAALLAGERGDTAGALERYESVLKREPDNGFALSRSGALLASLGRADEGIRRLARAVELRPQDGETKRVLAGVLERAGRMAAAADVWGKLAGELPRDLEAWIQLARTSMFAGRRDAARRALERAVALAPERGDLRELLAAVEREMARGGGR